MMIDEKKVTAEYIVLLNKLKEFEDWAIHRYINATYESNIDDTVGAVKGYDIVKNDILEYWMKVLSEKVYNNVGLCDCSKCVVSDD